MKMRRSILHMRTTAIICLSASTAICCAQYSVLPGETDLDGCFPKTPARICLGAGGASHCYSSPSDKDYIFGLEPRAKAVGMLNGKQLTLFTAMFSGCGSGTLTKFALLTTSNGEFVNLLPKVELTNQSEYRFWSVPAISSLPVLATADFVWDYKAMNASNYSKETHLAFHRYSIQAFIFDTKSGRYVQKAGYETTRKYPGLDDVDEIKVLEAEKGAILAKLMRRPG
jgi:hypothetical protein